MNTAISNYAEKSGNSFQTYADNRFAGTGISGGSFAQVILKQGAGATGNQGTVSPREMTMEQYKQYIAQKIKQIPVHPSRRNDCISVNISEEGYQAMKNDPEYEAWVLDNLRSVFSQPNFSFSGSTKTYIDIYIGATEDECHASSWSVPTRSASDRARERQEEYRRRLAKKIRKQKLQKQLLEIALQRQARQRALVKKLIEHRQEIERENRQRFRKAVVKDKPDGSRVLEITTKTKTIEKITERDILRVEEVLREMRLQQELLYQRFYEDGNFYGFQQWLMNG